MDFKSRKNLVIVAGVLLVISAVSFLLSGIFFLMYKPEIISGFIESFSQMESDPGYAFDYNEVVAMAESIFLLFVVAFIGGVAVSLGCAIFYFVRSSASEEDFDKKITSLIVVTVINFLFVGNYISAICAAVAVFTKSKKKVTVDAYSQNNVGYENSSINKEEETIRNIERLKKLRDNGTITDDEYAKLLSNIIK